ncbi:hsp70 nucleotide exchange factor fes1 [Podila verticillata]|nr:hsp70 nucleotide exchange factor fes1 [Haplosporangium bisporale]KAF9215348.1 hsp70 nucleotide exchange factor fes1 [Podila verticillata]KAF9369761.1 hsp70 nucleotide exchange factor fes1 [Podila verticillata]
MTSKSLNELLKWSIINQATESEDASPSTEPRKPMEKLDPGLIDAILGKSESQMMMEALHVIKNPQATNDEKDLAWEDFEMLIQQIDNACNVANMKMWPPILEELKNPNPKFREQAAWVCGTATQNNPKAQAAFMSEKGLNAVIELLSDSETYVRAKALYAISGAVKHFEPALQEFKALDGYKTLVSLLNNEHDIPLLRKTVFLINTLLIEDPASTTQLTELNLIGALNIVLSQHMDDEDLVEKSLVTLKTFFHECASVNPASKALIRPKILEAKEKYSKEILAAEDWAELEQKSA